MFVSVGRQAVSGGYSFVGGGEFIGIGSPYMSYCSIGSEYGTVRLLHHAIMRESMPALKT
jgi:hypothetical protein